jgi:hypothetical protein
MDKDSSQRMVFSQTGPGNVGAKASGVSKHPVQEQSDHKSPSSATSLLESWDVKSSFWKKHRTRLVREGLEIPDWMIISGRKT